MGLKFLEAKQSFMILLTKMRQTARGGTGSGIGSSVASDGVAERARLDVVLDVSAPRSLPARDSVSRTAEAFIFSGL